MSADLDLAVLSHFPVRHLNHVDYPQLLHQNSVPSQMPLISKRRIMQGSYKPISSVRLMSMTFKNIL